MQSQRSTASGVGLERSCSGATADWLRSTGPNNGVELLEAWLHGPAYHKHRHDTYAICLTTGGVQAFHYRGTREISLPGQVVVLHPDEVHDGHAGTDAGFGYRQLYVEPALIFEAVQVLRGQACALPFVRTPVVMSPKLADAVTCAFDSGREPLAMDSLVVQVAEGLLEADPSCTQVPLPRHLDVAALQRARAFLDAEKTRVVHSAELEAVTRSHPLRSGPPVSRAVWDEPLPLPAHAAACGGARADRAAPTVGRGGARGGVCRPGAFLADVHRHVWPHGAVPRASAADGCRSDRSVLQV